MSRTGVGRMDRYAVVCFVTVLMLGLSATAWGAAQFRLPKLPKLPKTGSQQQQQPQNAPTGPAPELTSIDPNSASPGAEGDLVLTGKNFNVGTGLRINCSGEQPTISNFKVESATRATVHVRFGFETKEGPCEIYLEQRPTSANSQGEITASSSGTVEVTQVKGVTFTISIPSAMPMALPVIYIGEGNMDFMAVMMKVQQAMQGSWNDAGKPLLLVTKGEVKLKQGDKIVFTLAASNVKEVGQMSMMGQNVGVFRLVCNDGKIYNFMEQEGQGLPKGKAVEVIKAALGK